jgi:hypothetical protein
VTGWVSWSRVGSGSRLAIIGHLTISVPVLTVYTQAGRASSSRPDAKTCLTSPSARAGALVEETSP